MSAAALGRRARIAISAANAFDASIWFDNPGPASPSFQVVLNGAIVLEGTYGQYLTCSFLRGTNVLQVCVADGGIVVGAAFVRWSLSPWASLYPAGADPMASGVSLSTTRPVFP